MTLRFRIPLGPALGVALALCAVTAPAGCVYQGRLSIRRLWADVNTLNEPALYYEKIDRFPEHAARVDHYRWMYNKGPNPRVPYQVIPEEFRQEYKIAPHVEEPFFDRSLRLTPNSPPPGELPLKHQCPLPAYQTPDPAAPDSSGEEPLPVFPLEDDPTPAPETAPLPEPAGQTAPVEGPRPNSDIGLRRMPASAANRPSLVSNRPARLPRGSSDSPAKSKPNALRRLAERLWGSGESSR